MEIARWVYYAVVSCALVSCIAGKTVSLNKLIESELNQKETVVHTTTSPKIEVTEPAAERFSLNKGLKPLNRISKKYKETGRIVNFLPLGKRISPLQYRKTFQIKSPLKPKRVKHSLRTRHKRKNQSIKREIDGHALLNQKYIPLLKSIGMLFDNILGTDSRESLEETKHKKKRLRYILEEEDGISCQCPRQRESNTESYSEEEAVTSSSAVASEITVTTETSATSTDYPSISDLRGFGYHQNVPLLLSRNTSSPRRNYHGIGERSRAAYNGSAERYISRDHGDSEHNPERRQERSDAESYQDNTNNDSRNDASSTGTRRTVRNRELRNNTEEIHENDAIVTKVKTKKLLEIGKGTTQFDGPYKLKNKRNKAKSGELLSKSFRRQRGFLSNSKVIASAESVQSEDDNKESIVNVAHDSTGDQRLTFGDGTHSSENQKINAGTETLTDPVFSTGKEKTDYSMKPLKAVNEGLGSKLSQAGQKYEEYEDKSGVDIAYDSFEDLPRSNSKDSHMTANLEPDSKSNTTLANQPAVEVLEYSEKPEIKTLFTISTGADGFDEEKASIERGKSIELQLSKEDATKEHSGKEPETETLKPLQAEIPQVFSRASKSSLNKGPMVMIIDGYSVTRHKNGENKLAEKTIRIRT